jgi:hypothetical protein
MPRKRWGIMATALLAGGYITRLRSRLRPGRQSPSRGEDGGLLGHHHPVDGRRRVYQLTELPGAAAWISVGSVLFVRVGWIAWAMAGAMHAADVATEIPTEEELREPMSAVPHIQGSSALDRS